MDCCICWESNDNNKNAVVAIGDITLDEKADCKDVGEFVEVTETNNNGKQVLKSAFTYLQNPKASKKRQQSARTKRAVSLSGFRRVKYASLTRQMAQRERKIALLSLTAVSWQRMHSKVS